MLSHFSVKLINTCKDFIRRCSSIKSIKNSRSAAIFSRMGRGARKRASACTWPFRMMAKRLAPAGQPPQMADFLLQSNKKSLRRMDIPSKGESACFRGTTLIRTGILSVPQTPVTGRPGTVCLGRIPARRLSSETMFRSPRRTPSHLPGLSFAGEKAYSSLHSF